MRFTIRGSEANQALARRGAETLLPPTQGAYFGNPTRYPSRSMIPALMRTVQATILYTEYKRPTRDIMREALQATPNPTYR
jgi:hypothetical protein